MRGVITHKLKIQGMYFTQIAMGQKTFEIRKDDRDFQVGDNVLLQVWKEKAGYLGLELSFQISGVFRGEEAEKFGVKEGYCIISIRGKSIKWE